MEGTFEARLESEALRLSDRYVREVVLAFGLCPWAEPALRGGRVGRAVCSLGAPTPAACLPFIDRFAAADVDIGLLLFPRHDAGWAAFDAFAERVRRADRDRRVAAAAVAETPPPSPVFLIAAFHPDGAETFDGAHQLLSFLRRTPDPMLQFVRAELIARLNTTRPGASEEVGRKNHQSLTSATGALGLARRQAFDDTVRAIRADRQASYARLGVASVPGAG